MAVVNLHYVHQIRMEIHFSFFLIQRINEYGLIVFLKVVLDEKWRIIFVEMSPKKVLVFATHWKHVKMFVKKNAKRFYWIVLLAVLTKIKYA